MYSAGKTIAPGRHQICTRETNLSHHRLRLLSIPKASITCVFCNIFAIAIPRPKPRKHAFLRLSGGVRTGRGFLKVGSERLISWSRTLISLSRGGISAAEGLPRGFKFWERGGIGRTGVSKIRINRGRLHGRGDPLQRAGRRHRRDRRGGFFHPARGFRHPWPSRRRASGRCG